MIDVVLDTRLTRQMSIGMKTYTRELAARLPKVAPDLQFTAFDRGENFSFDEQVRLPLAMAAARPRLVHLLSFYAPIVVPRPYVVTIHDVIHLQFPQFFKKKVPLYYHTVVRALLGRAARVITDDERTPGDLARFLGVREHRCRVIPLGVEPHFLEPIAPHVRERPYLFYAGNHREHKNVETLLRAWCALPAERPLDVILTGANDISALVARFARANGRIEFAGDIPAKQLARFYAGALAYVHPAFAEGFGLPMLEAMAAGAPVIASQESVPGVLRSSALTFAARDAQALAAAILRVWNEPECAPALRMAGQAAAQALTWDVCAARTAAVYREVLEERSTR